MSFQAGASRVDISPPAGIRLTGFSVRAGANQGVHDSLFARALVFNDGTSQFALVCCDLLGLDTATTKVLRETIEDATGIPAANIMLSCTHTHAGPACMFLRDCGEVELSYIAVLSQHIVTVVCEAQAVLRPARLQAGKTLVPAVSYNRRRADGPLDEELQVLRIDALNDSPLAVLLNFGCHPVTAGPEVRLVSADFPGAVTKLIETETGAVACFTNGACADINPIGAGKMRTAFMQPFAQIEAHGKTLHEATSALWDQLTAIEISPMQIQNSNLSLPLLPCESLQQLSDLAEEYSRKVATALRDMDDVRYRCEAAMLDWVMATVEAI